MYVLSVLEKLDWGWASLPVWLGCSMGQCTGPGLERRPGVSLGSCLWTVLSCLMIVILNFKKKRMSSPDKGTEYSWHRKIYDTRLKKQTVVWLEHRIGWMNRQEEICESSLCSFGISMMDALSPPPLPSSLTAVITACVRFATLCAYVSAKPHNLTSYLLSSQKLRNLLKAQSL